jgi:hypothetical protein
VKHLLGKLLFLRYGVRERRSATEVILDFSNRQRGKKKEKEASFRTKI